MRGLGYVKDLIDVDEERRITTPLPSLILADIIEAGGEHYEMDILAERDISRRLIDSECAHLEEMGMVGRYKCSEGTMWELSPVLASAIKKATPAFTHEDRLRRSMRGPQFDSSEDGKDALATVHDISGEVVDDLFDAVDEAAVELAEEYDVDDEVDLKVVQEYLKIAFCEDIARMCDVGVWDGEEDVQRIVDEMGEYAGANTRMMVGRVASRSRDMMRLSGAIMQDTYSRE